MEEESRKYIENQKRYASRTGSYGPFGSIAGNGCGAVAVYNILRHFGIPADFKELVDTANRRWLWSQPAFGLMGTNPLYLAELLRRYGFGTRILRLDRLYTDPDCDALIFAYAWKRGGKLGAHYQAAFPEADGGFMLHNPHQYFSSLKELAGRKRKDEGMFAAAVIAVRNRRRDG